MPTLPREIPVAVGLISDFSTFASPSRITLHVVRGDALRVVFRLCEEVKSTGCGSRGVNPQTLDGYEARATIRPSIDHSMSTPLTCVVDEDPGSGRVTITAAPEDTRMLYDWGGTWDVELSDGTDGFRKTIIRGDVELLHDVSL